MSYSKLHAAAKNKNPTRYERHQRDARQQHTGSSIVYNRNHSTGQSLEFASASPSGGIGRESPVRPSMEFAAVGPGATPPTHRSSLALLKKKMSRSGPKKKTRSQSAKRRNQVSKGETLARSNSERSLLTEPTVPEVKQCTRQSGCTCSQCQADDAFKMLLRSDSTSRTSGKVKSKRRPQWNNDFSEAVPPREYIASSDAKENKSANKTAAPKAKAHEKRPPWNSDFATEIHEREQSADEGASSSNYDTAQQGTFDDAGLANEDAYYGNMRSEMGGKADFLSAMEKRDPPRASTHGAKRSAVLAQAGARQMSGRMPAGKTLTHTSYQSQNAKAAYRGIYRPSSREQRAAPVPSFDAKSLHEDTITYDTAPTIGISDDMPTEQASVPVQLFQCHDCGRKFNEKALARHKNICKKVFMQKRKKFDAAQARLSEFSGNDKNLVKKVKKTNRRARASSKSSNKAGKWKRQSEQLRQAMMANKEYALAKKEGRPPPPVSSVPSVDPDLVPCPHCGRSFNEAAAERHIPRCQNIKAKPKRLMRGSGRNAGLRR